MLRGISGRVFYIKFDTERILEGFSHPTDFFVNLKQRLLDLIRSTSIFLMHLMYIRGIIKSEVTMRLESALSGDELGLSALVGICYIGPLLCSLKFCMCR